MICLFLLTSVVQTLCVCTMDFVSMGNNAVLLYVTVCEKVVPRLNKHDDVIEWNFRKIAPPRNENMYFFTNGFILQLLQSFPCSPSRYSLLLTVIGVICYYAVGYPFAYGEPGNAFIGHNYFFATNINYESNGTHIVSGTDVVELNFLSKTVYILLIIKNACHSNSPFAAQKNRQFQG